MNEFFVTLKDGQPTSKARQNRPYGDCRDGIYIITVKSARKRSNNQNRFLHGVLIPAFYQGLRDNGYDDVQTHSDAKMVMKALFLKRDIINYQTGEVITVPRDTHDLSPTEMNEFFDAAIKFAAEWLNTSIEYPNEKENVFV